MEHSESLRNLQRSVRIQEGAKIFTQELQRTYDDTCYRTEDVKHNATLKIVSLSIIVGGIIGGVISGLIVKNLSANSWWIAWGIMLGSTLGIGPLFYCSTKDHRQELCLELKTLKERCVVLEKGDQEAAL